MVGDTPRELGRIARYLGVEVGEDALRRVAAEHALGEMKKRQPHHVFRGGWGGWLEYLNDRQVHTVQRIAGQMMKALGYPLKRVGNIGIITPFPPALRSGPGLYTQIRDRVSRAPGGVVMLGTGV